MKLKSKIKNVYQLEIEIKNKNEKIQKEYQPRLLDLKLLKRL